MRRVVGPLIVALAMLGLAAAAAVIVLLGSLAWLGAARAARLWAEGDGHAWWAAEWFAHCGKWYVFAASFLLLLGITTRTPGLLRRQK